MILVSLVSYEKESNKVLMILKNTAYEREKNGKYLEWFCSYLSALLHF
jgi:hypothetical protein